MPARMLVGGASLVTGVGTWWWLARQEPFGRGLACNALSSLVPILGAR
jgi:hypothetical protein